MQIIRETWADHDPNGGILTRKLTSTFSLSLPAFTAA
jgi:hypothetical protein